jgi:hypothetical protein
VKIAKPKNVTEFLNSLSAYKQEKQKAENVLIDEVETEVDNKEKFIND